jgi:hypothetical protein
LGNNSATMGVPGCFRAIDGGAVRPMPARTLVAAPAAFLQLQNGSKKPPPKIRPKRPSTAIPRFHENRRYMEAPAPADPPARLRTAQSSANHKCIHWMMRSHSHGSDAIRKLRPKVDDLGWKYQIPSIEQSLASCAHWESRSPAVRAGPSLAGQ